MRSFLGEDISALYAGPKFSDSPSAKRFNALFLIFYLVSFFSLPMPPTQWLEEAKSVRRASATRSPNLKSSQSALKHVAEEVTTDDDGFSSMTDDSSSSSSGSLQPVVFRLDSRTSSECESQREEQQSPKLQSQHSNSSNGSLHDPASEGQLAAKSVEGIRLHPLQLIAAVAAS